MQRKSINWFLYHFLFNWVHSTQSWPVTTKHEVPRGRERQRWKTYKEDDQKEPKDKRYLVSSDLKPFRSTVKGKHSAGFQSVAMWGKGSLTRIISSASCCDENLQSNTYKKNLTRLHFNDQPNIHEKQQVKDQQPYKPATYSIAYPTY